MRASVIVVALVALACVNMTLVDARAGPLAGGEEMNDLRPSPSGASSWNVSAPFVGCSFRGVNGECMPVNQCQQQVERTSLPQNLCPGGDDIQCCIYQHEAAPGCGTAAVQRAQTWVNANLKYCQAVQGGRDWSGFCPAYCYRAHNRRWDAYRSDCSGLVSWAYGLPAPGRVTSQFAPYTNDISYRLNSAADLVPGDAINATPDGHIMIFRAWLNGQKTSASFLEEGGCPGGADRRDTAVTINGDGTITLSGRRFWPIRFFSNKGPC